MICTKCKKAADKGKKHPKNCGCTCQHRKGAWEDMHSVPRPDTKEK